MATTKIPEKSIDEWPALAFGAGTKWFQGYSHNLDEELDEKIISSVLQALNSGFRYLDLSEQYGNEREVGVAIQKWISQDPESNRRDKLFICSKVFYNLSVNKIVSACQASIQRLGVEYLDLWLLHGPLHFRKIFAENSLSNHPLTGTKIPSMPPLEGAISEIWKEMEQCKQLNLTRDIGISNFRGSDLRSLMESKPLTAPAINQFEFHPYLQQPELRKLCQEYKIRTQAYSPLSSLHLWPNGPIDEYVNELAQKYETCHSAILIWYAKQKGFSTIVTTSEKSHRLKEFLEASAQFSQKMLTFEEIEKIDQLGSQWHRRKYWIQVSGFEAVKDAGLE